MRDTEDLIDKWARIIRAQHEADSLDIDTTTSEELDEVIDAIERIATELVAQGRSN